MHIALSTILSLLETYKYIVLFPIAVIEGPIVTMAAGLLVSLGYFYGPTAYFIIVVADTVGDGLHYLIGYFIRHKRVEGLLRLLSIREEKLVRIESHFEKHPKKTVLIGKFLPGVGGMTQVAAGVARMPFMHFIFYCVLGTIPKAFVLLFVGYGFGQYLEKIDNYFSLASILFLAATLLIIVGYIAVSKIIEKKSLL